jgi:hypothetical protein
MAVAYFKIDLTVSSTIYRPTDTPITPNIVQQYILEVDSTSSPGTVVGIYNSSQPTVNLFVSGNVFGSTTDNLFDVSSLLFSENGTNFQDPTLEALLAPFYPIDSFGLTGFFSFFNIFGQNLLGSYTGEPGGSNIWFISMIITSGSPPLPCFRRGTQILTSTGYRPIEDLRRGDLIKTSHHNYQRVTMIGSKEIQVKPSHERVKDQLYRLTREKYPEIFDDLIITGCHSILVDKFIDNDQREKTKEVLKKIYVTDGMYRLPACVDMRAEIYMDDAPTVIYHMALEHPDIYMNYGVYANGLLVETCSKRYLKELSHMLLIDE